MSAIEEERAIAAMALARGADAERCTYCRCPMLPEWRGKRCPTCREHKRTLINRWRRLKKNRARVNAQQNARDRARIDRLRAEGRCVVCEEPHTGKGVRCATCAADKADYMRATRAKEQRAS